MSNDLPPQRQDPSNLEIMDTFAEDFSIPHTIDRYVNDLNALDFAFPLTTNIMSHSFQLGAQSFAKSLFETFDEKDCRNFVKAFSQFIEAKDDNYQFFSFEIPDESPEQSEALMVSMRHLSQVASAGQLVSRSFIMALISQFDAYIGNLIRSIYQIKPNILNLYSKSIPFFRVDPSK